MIYTFLRRIGLSEAYPLAPEAVSRGRRALLPKKVAQTRHVASTTSAATQERGARRANLVAEWRTYLSSDCVDMMIKKGWDRTV